MEILIKGIIGTILIVLGLRLLYVFYLIIRVNYEMRKTHKMFQHLIDEFGKEKVEKAMGKRLEDTKDMPFFKRLINLKNLKDDL